MFVKSVFGKSVFALATCLLLMPIATSAAATNFSNLSKKVIIYAKNRTVI